MTDTQTSLASLAGQAGAEAQRAKEYGDTIAEQAARQELGDRALITRTVTTVFFIAVPLSLIALLVLAFVSAASAKDAIAGITDILKSVLLPVLTLVLGYYFGRGRG